MLEEQRLGQSAVALEEVPIRVAANYPFSPQAVDKLRRARRSTVDKQHPARRNHIDQMAKFDRVDKLQARSKVTLSN